MPRYPLSIPATPTRMGMKDFFDSISGAFLFCYLSLYDELLTVCAIAGDN